MCGHVQPCAGMCGHVQPCAGMCSHVQPCAGMCRHDEPAFHCTSTSKDPHGCMVHMMVRASYRRIARAHVPVLTKLNWQGEPVWPLRIWADKCPSPYHLLQWYFEVEQKIECGRDPRGGGP